MVGDDHVGPVLDGLSVGDIDDGGGAPPTLCLDEVGGPREAGFVHVAERHFAAPTGDLESQGPADAGAPTGDGAHAPVQAFHEVLLGPYVMGHCDAYVSPLSIQARCPTGVMCVRIARRATMYASCRSETSPGSGFRATSSLHRGT